MTESAPELPAGWRRWNDHEQGAAIFVYRPDVFDSHQYPAACLPTIYVRPRPPGRQRRRANERHEGWFLAVHLEPEVRIRDVESAHETRAEALEAATEVARQFADGEIDYRSAYQVPREAYLDELDALTGREA